MKLCLRIHLCPSQAGELGYAAATHPVSPLFLLDLPNSIPIPMLCLLLVSCQARGSLGRPAEGEHAGRSHRTPAYHKGRIGPYLSQIGLLMHLLRKVYRLPKTMTKTVVQRNGMLIGPHLLLFYSFSKYTVFPVLLPPTISCEIWEKPHHVSLELQFYNLICYLHQNLF